MDIEGQEYFEDPLGYLVGSFNTFLVGNAIMRGARGARGAFLWLPPAEATGVGTQAV
jgi:hypothetical protein